MVNSVQNEGFANGPKAKVTKPTKSEIEIQIRKILDAMDSKGLCPLYKTIRTNMAKNEKAGQDISDQEVNKRVEAALALKIPGGALPCPLLTYPKAGSSDLEWLDFLQQVPSDFGARVVLMAIYAQGFLADKEQILKDALSGKGTPPIFEMSWLANKDGNFRVKNWPSHLPFRQPETTSNPSFNLFTNNRISLGSFSKSLSMSTIMSPQAAWIPALNAAVCP